MNEAINFAGLYLFLFFGLPLIVGIIGGIWGIVTHGQTRSAWAEIPIARPVEPQVPVFEKELVDNERVEEIVNEITKGRDELTYHVSEPSVAMERNINDLFLAIQEQPQQEILISSAVDEDDNSSESTDPDIEEKLEETYWHNLSEQFGDHSIQNLEDQGVSHDFEVQTFLEVTTPHKENMEVIETDTNSVSIDDQVVETPYMEEDILWECAGENEESEHTFDDEAFSFDTAPSVLQPAHYKAIERKFGSIVAQAITTTPAFGPTGMHDVMIGRISHSIAGYALHFADSSILLSGNFRREDGLTVLVYGQFISYEKFYVAKCEDPFSLSSSLPFSYPIEDENVEAAVST
ncbi:hypothetical protein [Brevibacillus sp. 179-C9.3 HS]|uniref:hypothetical protein n=1 Tax=unclassified Brevibacillus TaxID=2684853 RepID=UPI00399F5B81